MNYTIVERMDADREAVLRDLEAEELLEQRPVCDECGEHIRADHYFQIGKNIICPDCLDDFLVWID